MKTLSILLISVSLLLTGCFAPVNLSYESAKTLNKGQAEVQGSWSQYYAMNDSTYQTARLNNNFGASFAYGIADNYTLKFRYEYMNFSPMFRDIFGDSDFSSDLSKLTTMSYFELSNKIKLVKNNFSVGLPVGLYVYNKTLFANDSTRTGLGLGWFCFDPKFYISFFRKTKIFELTVIPKAHVMFGYFGFYGQLGVSLGMAFSSNLDRWSIRPEIGYDKFLSFGVAGCYNFNIIKPKGDPPPVDR
jgi:hypothetical protein